MLSCRDCKQPHDFDATPDTGDCACGGKLVEQPDEQVGGLETAIVAAVTDGLAASAIARGKASCGSN